MSNDKTKQPKTQQTIETPEAPEKSFFDYKKWLNKDFFAMIATILMAASSVYLVGPWVRTILEFPISTILYNFGAVASVAITLYAAAVMYNRGGWNIAVKFMTVAFFSILTVILIILSSNSMNGLWYPLTGIFILYITFYMVVLSSKTLTLKGISAIAIILSSLILGSMVYNNTTYDDAIFWMKISLTFIFAIGAVLPKIRYWLHGIKGVNNDGGFGRTNDDDFGDENDGDGDTEGE